MKNNKLKKNMGEMSFILDISEIKYYIRLV